MSREEGHRSFSRDRIVKRGMRQEWPIEFTTPDSKFLGASHVSALKNGSVERGHVRNVKKEHQDNSDHKRRLSCRARRRQIVIKHFRNFLAFRAAPILRGTFVSHQRVSGFPETGADLWGCSGNFWGSPGNLGSLGNFRGTSGLLLKSTEKKVAGKSPGNFRGSAGELWKVQRGF